MNSDFGASSDAPHHDETMLPHDQEQHEYETMRHPSHSGHHKAHEDYIKMIPAFAGLTIQLAPTIISPLTSQSCVFVHIII